MAKKKSTPRVSSQLNKAIKKTASSSKSKTAGSENKRIAKASGIKPNTLNKIRAGKINPPTPRLKKIAKATSGVSTTSLNKAKKATLPKRKTHK